MLAGELASVPLRASLPEEQKLKAEVVRLRENAA
jgi:hypothetical protein